MLRRAALPVTLILATLLLGGCPDGVERTAGKTPRFVQAERGPTPAPTATPKPVVPVVTPNPAGTQAPKRPPVKGPYGPYGSQRMTGVRGVALTFDDGPHPVYTPKVLNQLKAAGVKATFCVVGTEVRQYPALVARIVREGHSLCNHSWRHDIGLGKRSEAQIRADLARTNQEIKRAAPGATIPFYRQPGGKWTAAVVKVAKSLGMTPLHWDTDPSDWEKPAASVISKRVIGLARAGSVILLHDGGGDRSTTVAAVPGLIATLKRKLGITLLR
jgi:peptidoglycan/xylan/chitin deacetylase (PgdA/CDA1 family)